MTGLCVNYLRRSTRSFEDVQEDMLAQVRAALVGLLVQLLVGLRAHAGDLLVRSLELRGIGLLRLLGRGQRALRVLVQLGIVRPAAVHIGLHRPVEQEIQRAEQDDKIQRVQ